MSGWNPENEKMQMVSEGGGVLGYFKQENHESKVGEALPRGSDTEFLFSAKLSG